jgi:predicted NAD-dependent protein-ADP-ribosyltransferase YbiA (DUF1768 family)
MEDVVNYSGETADGPHGFLSNRALIGFTIDGRQWPSVEHYFQVGLAPPNRTSMTFLTPHHGSAQAQKFVGSDHEEAIRKAKTVKAAHNMGAQPSPAFTVQ